MAESVTTPPEDKGKKSLKRSDIHELQRPGMSQDEPRLKRWSSYEMLPPELSELRVVLLGNNQSERNAVGDLLLRQCWFRGHDMLNDCMIGSGQVENKPLVVINTPDLLHPDISPAELSKKIQSCVKHFTSEPCVFVLVLQPKEFTEEQRLKLQNVLQGFSDHPFDHSLVLVSTQRKLCKRPMRDYMQHPQLYQMICKCRYRHLYFQTFSEEELSELLARLGQVVKENNGQSDFTSDITVPNPLNIVLIGKTGVGKSSSGNTILGHPVFLFRSSHSAVTKHCQREEGEVDGRPVVVIDTPGLFDMNLSAEDLQQGITDCIKLLDTGLHVFLLVLRIGTITTQDKETVKLIQTTLGKKANTFTIILFTGGDSLEQNKQSIEDYIKPDDDDSLKNLIDDCGGRYNVFNNCDQKNRKQVSDLLKTVEEMVKVNGGGCYTVKMFQEAHVQDERKSEEEVLAEMHEIRSNMEQMEEQLKEMNDSIQEEQMKRKQAEKRAEKKQSELKVKSKVWNTILKKQRQEIRELQESLETKQGKVNQMIEDLIKRREAEIKRGEAEIERGEAEINDLKGMQEVSSHRGKKRSRL